MSPVSGTRCSLCQRIPQDRSAGRQAEACRRDASHAWVSLYCGELGWVDLDPTNNLLPNTDHITLAYGRDYSDVSPIKGVFVGGGQHGMSVSVDVSPSEQNGV